MEEVNVENKNDIFSNVGKSTANKLYKDYVKWHKDKYGDKLTCMSFGEFLNWAKDRNIIAPKSYSGEGGETEQEQKDDAKPTKTGAFTGKKVVSSLILFSLSALIVTSIFISLTKSK